MTLKKLLGEIFLLHYPTLQFFIGVLWKKFHNLKSIFGLKSNELEKSWICLQTIKWTKIMYQSIQGLEYISHESCMRLNLKIDFIGNAAEFRRNGRVTGEKILGNLRESRSIENRRSSHLKKCPSCSKYLLIYIRPKSSMVIRRFSQEGSFHLES